MSVERSDLCACWKAEMVSRENTGTMKTTPPDDCHEWKRVTVNIGRRRYPNRSDRIVFNQQWSERIEAQHGRPLTQQEWETVEADRVAELRALEQANAGTET